MSIKRTWAGLMFICAVQGCATVSVDQMTVSSGFVTSARNGYPFEETPMKQIKQRDSLIVVTHLKWEPSTAEAGFHSASWTWYDGSKVIAVRHKDVKLQQNPARLSWRLPAADFDPGHYRVDIAIDNKIVDTQEYDIVK